MIRITRLISIHFVKFRIFTQISISFINFRINTSISIHIRKCHIRKFFGWLFAYNSLKPHNTGMHTGIQNLLSWEQNIHVSPYKTYLDDLDKFIFLKKRIESSFCCQSRSSNLYNSQKCCFLIGWENTFNPFCLNKQTWCFCGTLTYRKQKISS